MTDKQRFEQFWTEDIASNSSADDADALVIWLAAVKAEREACAELCDLWNRTPGSELAKEIRKRSTEFLAEVGANRNGGA